MIPVSNFRSRYGQTSIQIRENQNNSCIVLHWTTEQREFFHSNRFFWTEALTWLWERTWSIKPRDCLVPPTNVYKVCWEVLWGKIVFTRNVVFDLLHGWESVVSHENVTKLHLHQAACLASWCMETTALACSGWCCEFEFPRIPGAVVSRGDATVPSLHLCFLWLFSLSMESLTKLK